MSLSKPSLELDIRENLRTAVSTVRGQRIQRDDLPADHQAMLTRIAGIYGIPVALWRGGFQGASAYIAAWPANRGYSVWF